MFIFIYSDKTLHYCAELILLQLYFMLHSKSNYILVLKYTTLNLQLNVKFDYIVSNELVLLQSLGELLGPAPLVGHVGTLVKVHE